MAYTPELSRQDSATLRRIAWALDVPMTEAMTRVLEEVAARIDRQRVCAACKDRTSCDVCAFNPQK
jgi:recombinational DNA repair protein RecR